MKAKVKTWIKNVENGNIKGMAEKVLVNIKYCKHINTNQLRKILNISHQSLTSVLSNLNDEGLIKVVGQVEEDNEHYSVYEFVSDDFERNLVIMRREHEKLLQWLKRGERFDHLLSDETLLAITKELKLKT